MAVFAMPAAHAQTEAVTRTPAPPAANVELGRVEVVGTTPLPGTGVSRDKVPANVQTLGTARIDELGASNLPDLMRRSLGSVSVVETQGNPYQMEVNFRGFTASPLLGQPQGLSVFLDGVRINEGFGDIVNWDLVPKNALASLTLVPGSNPVFGLNTLGGALALTTRSGDTHAGTEMEASLGSFGRQDIELSHGTRVGEDTYFFIAGDLFQEDGWREASPSQVRQLFAKLNGEHGPLEWSASLQGADNTLVGNGPLPESMLAQNRGQVYTRPDTTNNRLLAVTLRGAYDLGEGRKVETLGYARKLDTGTVNGDLNGDWQDGTSTFTGIENRTSARQRSTGAALQWNQQHADSLVTLGVSHDRSHTAFEQTSAAGDLDVQRAVVHVQPAALNAALNGRTSTSSVYAASNLALNSALTLSAASRYNRTQVTTIDTGAAQGTGTALDGRQTFHAFNPALGVTYTTSPALTVYGGISQGNRAPSPVELGCSDPANPCILPNALQADPPLKQVVSRTMELGLRGRLDSGWRWNASVFSTENRDDILFVSSGGATPTGYFSNFGKTRRQGLEAGLSGHRGAWDLALNYTLLNATYGSAACLVASANSSTGLGTDCSAGEIQVRPGDRLPGLPRQLLKLDLGWRAMPGVRVGANLQTQSGVYLRGNDNQQQQPDGATFNGSGRTAGFAVLNLQASWKFSPGWSLLGKVNNVLDTRYATGGVLGRNAFGANGALLPAGTGANEAFVAPGAPRSLSLALQWRFTD
ncbi:TonB-dependent receptor [Sphaerotilus sp.]|uniref:TonB-dependent receptor n=1 Tax=Sphaerotilus sp. TaxID=2093942 RepID=UPI0034E1CD53